MRRELQTYRRPESRMRAEVTTVDNGWVEASQELEVPTPGARLHHIQSILDTKL